MTQNFDKVSREIVEFHVGDCSCEQDHPCDSCRMVHDISEALQASYDKGSKDAMQGNRSIKAALDEEYERGFRVGQADEFCNKTEFKRGLERAAEIAQEIFDSQCNGECTHDCDDNKIAEAIRKEMEWSGK